MLECSESGFFGITIFVCFIVLFNWFAAKRQTQVHFGYEAQEVLCVFSRFTTGPAIGSSPWYCPTLFLSLEYDRGIHALRGDHGTVRQMLINQNSKAVINPLPDGDPNMEAGAVVNLPFPGQRVIKLSVAHVS